MSLHWLALVLIVAVTVSFCFCSYLMSWNFCMTFHYYIAIYISAALFSCCTQVIVECILWLLNAFYLPRFYLYAWLIIYLFRLLRIYDNCRSTCNLMNIFYLWFLPLDWLGLWRTVSRLLFIILKQIFIIQ